MYNNSSSRQPVIRMAARAVSPWDVVLAAAAWGTVLAQCGEGEGVAVATIEPSLVSRVRRQLPSLAHRRL